MNSNIPRVIHQIWSNIEEPLPDFFREFMKTWRKHHPDWKYIIWDNGKMNGFIQEFYPEYWISYNSAKYNIQKWDIIRYVILYHYGGMYVDVDYECRGSLESLLENNKGCYFSGGPVFNENSLDWENNFNNSLMISIPQHPFMRLIIDSAFCELMMKRNYPNKFIEVLSTTGPALLTKLYKTNADNSDVYIIPSMFVTPLNYSDVEQYMSGNTSPAFTKYIQDKLMKAVAVHYFMRTWLAG